MHQPAVGEARTAGPSASSSVKQIGSPPRLPDVITSTRGPGASPGRPNSSSVQRRVGEHDAEVRVIAARRHRRQPVRSGRRRQQHDRPLRAGQQPRATARRRRRSARAVARSAHHDGERLVAAPLSPSQLGDRVLVGRVAGQVVSADALDREDPAVAQQPPGLPQRDRRRGAAVAGRGSAASGPQFGQQTGWAWKRRSAGSAYSRAHSAHIAKAAIVVAARS